jgi:hypothetical protein
VLGELVLAELLMHAAAPGPLADASCSQLEDGAEQRDEELSARATEHGGVRGV